MAIQISKFSEKSSDTLPCYEETRGNESRAYLYVDLSDHEIFVGYKSTHDNSWGVREHRGYVRKFRLPNNWTVKGYNDFMSQPELSRLVEQLIDESEEVYDGSNYRMQLSVRGQEIIYAIERLCDDAEFEGYASLQPVCAFWYLQDDTYEDLMANGDTHEGLAKKLIEEARKDGYYLTVGDIENRLDEMAEEAAES